MDPTPFSPDFFLIGLGTGDRQNRKSLVVHVERDIVNGYGLNLRDTEHGIGTHGNYRGIAETLESFLGMLVVDDLVDIVPIRSFDFAA